MLLQDIYHQNHDLPWWLAALDDSDLDFLFENRQNVNNMSKFESVNNTMKP
jgi:hypothetical protein